MSVPLQIVVASQSLENRRRITTVLVNLGLDPICISSLSQCRELLARERVDLVFCDRFLADGDYLEALSACQSGPDWPYFVLACQHSNTEYQQAMAEGVFDVITQPCRPTDVEWMLIQVKRKLDRRSEKIRAGAEESLSSPKLVSKRIA